MSAAIISRIDEMGTRIDDLEKSISDLMQQVIMSYYYLYEVLLFDCLRLVLTRLLHIRVTNHPLLSFIHSLKIRASMPAPYIYDYFYNLCLLKLFFKTLIFNNTLATV